MHEDPPPGVPWDTPFDACPFALLDLEMTGLDPARDAIVEVAVLRLEGLRPVERFESLVRTEHPSSPGAVALHGIDAGELAGAPRLEEVLPRVAALLAGAVPVAHGAALDGAFLRAAFEASTGAPPAALRTDWTLDTLTLARRALHARAYGLGALVERLRLGTFRLHRAAEDVRALHALFGHLAGTFRPVSARDLHQVRVGQQGTIVVRDAIAGRLARAATTGALITVVFRVPGREATTLRGRVLRWTPPHAALAPLGPRGGARIVRADRVLSVEA